MNITRDPSSTAEKARTRRGAVDLDKIIRADISPDISPDDKEAMAAHEAGGILVRVSLSKPVFIGNGCGCPVTVPGTNSTILCGGKVAYREGDKQEILCHYCSLGNTAA